MNEKKYYINCDDITGITIYGVAENETERAVPDWLPDFVKAKIESAEDGSTTYYESDGNQYEEKPEGESVYPNLSKTIKVTWSRATCETHEVTRYGEQKFFTYDGVYSYERIIGMIGDVDALSEEQKKLFAENGETVEGYDKNFLFF